MPPTAAARPLVAMLAHWARDLSHGLAALKIPVGGDFIIYYAASKLTLAGRGLEAFNEAAFTLAQRSVLASTPAGLTWNYPPPYQLLIAPLALIPYAPSYLLFMILTAVPYLLLLRRIAGPGPWVWFLALVFPGAVGNIVDGQNGFLTCAILGWGLLLCPSRPLLAGAILGLLIYKPQFALLLPALFIGRGDWRVIAGAAASAGGLLALSTGVFGLAAWRAFLSALPAASAALQDGALPWAKIPSVLVFARSLGAAPLLAQAAQAAAALGAAAATLACWRRPAPHGFKLATAILASFLISPYAFNYDLVLLAVPLAVFACALRDGTLPASPPLLAAMAAMAVLPAVSVHFTELLGVQPSALVILGCFVVAARVAWRAGEVAPSGGVRPLTA